MTQTIDFTGYTLRSADALVQWGARGSPSTFVGLNYLYNGGAAVAFNGAVSLVAQGSLTLPNNATSYVERTYTGTVSSNTTGFTAGALPMARVVTSGGAITVVDDFRPIGMTFPYFAADVLETGVADVRFQTGDVRRYGMLAGNSSFAVANTTAMANAMASLSALGGGEVTIPGGVWWTGAILLRTSVYLKGTGPRGAQLKAKAGLNTHVIQLFDVNTEFTGAANLMIDGNANTMGAPSDGVHLENVGGTFTYSDPYYRFRDVFVANTNGAGWYLSASVRESRFENCHAKLCRGSGFEVNGTDNFFEDCTAATSFLDGWYITNGNNHFTSCKGFSSGQAMASGSDHAAGFRIQFSGRNLFTNCSAQDNGLEGWLINGSTAVLNQFVSCTADSNGNCFNGVSTNAAGWRFNGSASKNIIRGGVSANQRSTQDFALQMSAGCLGNRIDMMVDGNRDSVLFPTALGGSYAGNELRLIPTDTVETVTYAASVTPNPYTGATKAITLTGNITIANPLDTDADSSAAGAYLYPGMRIAFVFTQDGTGGRTVTFGTAYKSNWTPTTTANLVNRIEFEYNGSKFIQASTAVGL